jgi:hypothetical protein
MEFDITQSNNFDAPTLTITNDDRKFGASWTSTDGARGYGVVIYDSLGVELTQITLGNNIFELNMTNFAAATGLTDYVGQIGISVKALTPQPDYFAESERILSNSHFADNGGNGMDASERFVISNERHLQNVSTAYPKGYFYYILGNSFDLSGKAMPSIGTVTSPFVGDFDGGSKNGLKVSNSAYERAEVDNTFLYYGMFGYVGNKGTRVSQIANFNFENCNLTINPAFNTANICWAIGVGSSNGATISNIKTTDCGILFNTKPNGNNNSNQSVGMIVGAQNGGRITGCVTEGGRIGREETILTGNHNNGISLGGIVGRTFGTVGPLPTLIEYCANISTVIRGHFAGGGIIGKAEGRTNVVDCYNMAPIFASGAVGGIVGGLTVSASELLVERCWNSGTLEYVRSNGPAKMGGIVGDGNYAVAITLSRCFNSGEIKFYNEGAAELNRVTNIGGLGGWLAGTAAPGRSRIYNCYNRGNVTVTIGGLSGPQTFAGTGNGGVGGIAGFMGGAGADVNARGNLQNSYNSGEVRVILEGATPGTVNALGNIFGRTNANQTQQPMYNAVYTGSIFAGDNPANAVIGAGNNVATFTTGFYRFTDLSSQAAFEALNDGGQSFDFSNIWEMKQGGYPILRGLYGNPAQ